MDINKTLVFIVYHNTMNNDSEDYFRADSRLAPSQWETLLQSNTISHWLGANLETALIFGWITICLLAVLCKSWTPSPRFHNYLLFWIKSSGQQGWYKITGIWRNLTGNMSHFVISIVPADGLALSKAEAFTGTVCLIVQFTIKPLAQTSIR